MEKYFHKTRGSLHLAAGCPDKLRPRIFRVNKKADHSGFGLKLKFRKKGDIAIEQVEANSPADVAGMVAGDKVIQLNGTPVSHIRYKDMEKRTRENGNTIILAVINPKSYQLFKRHGVNIKKEFLAYVTHHNEKLKRYNVPSLSFNLNSVNGMIRVSDVDSRAQAAGLRIGDVLREVEGAGVRGEHLLKVYTDIRCAGDHVWLTISRGRKDRFPSLLTPIAGLTQENDNQTTHFPSDQNAEMTRKSSLYPDLSTAEVDGTSSQAPLPVFDLEPLRNSLPHPGGDSLARSHAPAFKSLSTDASKHDQTPGHAFSPVQIRTWLMKIKSHIEEERQCTVCFERERCVTFSPCGHLVCCLGCADILKSCPLCRSRIQEKIRTFFN